MNMGYGSKVNKQKGAGRRKGTPKKTRSEESAEDLDELPSSSSCSSTNNTLTSVYVHQRVVWMFPFAVPKLYPYLPKRDLLSCRQVCRLWRQGVQDFLESDNYFPILVQQLGVANNWDTNRKWSEIRSDFITRPVTNLGFDKIEMWSKITKEINESIASVNNFLAIFKDPDRNPFPTRAVAIFLLTAENIDPLGTFLEKFGKHIWTLQLRVENNHIYINENEVLHLIWKLLKFVPNLRNLLIATPPLTSRDFDYDIFLDILSVPALNNLRFIEMDVSKMVKMVVRNAYGKIMTKSDDYRGPVTIFERIKGLTRRNYFSKDLKHLHFHANSSLVLCPPVKYLREDIWLPLESISVQVSTLKDVLFEEILGSLVKFRLTLRQFTVTFNGLQIDDIQKIREQIPALYSLVIPRMKVLKQFNIVLDSAANPILLHQLADYILKENLKNMQFSMHFLGRKTSGFVTLMATRRVSRRSMEQSIE